MPDHTYDVLIIGAGQAGVPLAFALADAGRRVALAERARLGGSCVNFGCTPTKAAVRSAEVAHLARRGRAFGIDVPEVSVDFGAVIRRARRVAADSRDGLQQQFEGSDNPQLLRGHARFTGRDGGAFTLTVDDVPVRAEQVVIGTGARTLWPPIDGLDGIEPLHAGNWLDLEAQPSHLVIVGGGYIGLEMAQFYRRMGSEVTVVHGTDQVAPREDADVAEALQEVLAGEGVTFHLACEATRVERSEGGLRLWVEDAAGDERVVEGSHLFVATGRRPNTDDLGLETIGLDTDERGFIDADAHLRTAVGGVWAAGDVRGGPLFTHTSYDDFRIIRSAMLADGAHDRDRVVPYAIFTDPQLGRVGLTEKAAREAGHAVAVARMPMEKSGKANEIGETAGFIKVVVDAETSRILGAAALAHEGAEIVHAYITAMNADVPYTVIRDAVHIHPTFSEAVQSVLQEVEE